MTLDVATLDFPVSSDAPDVCSAPMSFRLQRRKWTNADGSLTETWRLIIEDFTGKSRTSIYPKKENYPHYGFDPEDTYEVAMEKLQSVRARENHKRAIMKRARIDQRLKKEDLKESAYLPRDLWPQFIKFLKGRRAWGQVPHGTESHLRAMRKMVLEIDLDPTEWPMQAGAVYHWFIKNHYSLSYLDKVLPFANEYGYFYCQHFKKSFIPIPPPPSRIIEKINDSNIDSREGKTNESKPLTQELLNKLERFAPEKFRWMQCSFYFGLRPDEVDALSPVHHGKRWIVENDGAGVKILVIYQPKLVRVPRAKRWKRIPCILPEQIELIEEIRRGEPVKRPYAKYIQRYLGEGYTLYAGRKGFESLMRKHGQAALNIIRWQGKREFRTLDDALRSDRSYSDPGNAKSVSEWLGHRSINRTQADYVDHDTVDYDPVEPRENPPRPTRKT